MTYQKRYQRYYSSMTIIGKMNDLTAEWVDAAVSHHKGGWLFEPSVFLEGVHKKEAMVTLPCSYAKVGADRSCIVGLAMNEFVIPYGLKVFVPTVPEAIVRLAKPA